MSIVPLLELNGISKSFGGNLVLSDVDLELYPGEAHALVGENGAGKSTLVKILCGVHRRDGGSIRLEGRELQIETPHEARAAGIGMIFQESTLASHLSVAQNIFLGMESAGRFGLLDNRSMNAAARRILEKHRFELNPLAPVRRLTRAGQQLVEIARALTRASRIVVMDEPTSMLSNREAEELFRIIRDLKRQGLAVVYISHRMEELAQVADRITILRDGRRVFSGLFRDVDEHGIVRHMVGREITELFPAQAEAGAEPALELESLGNGRSFHNVSLQLHRGEVLGLAGLVGAGRTALVRAVFGLEPRTEGRVRLAGREARFETPGDAIDAGVGYLTEDRKITSLFPHLSVAHNISIAALGKLQSGFRLRLGEEARRCRSYIESLRIRTSSERAQISRLSGGNQQKALVARWLFAGSNVLLLDEPTQGVDLGARAELYRLMHDFVGGGGAILMVSSDLTELLGMSHRIAVMRRGEIVATVVAAQSNPEEIMRHAAFGDAA